MLQFMSSGIHLLTEKWVSFTSPLEEFNLQLSLVQQVDCLCPPPPHSPPMCSACADAGPPGQYSRTHLFAFHPRCQSSCTRTNSAKCPHGPIKQIWVDVLSPEKGNMYTLAG